MAYDEKLAERVRSALGRKRGLSEKKMFGGICFFLRGNMIGGIRENELILRVGDGAEKALKRKHTRPFDITGRTMRGFVMVEPAGFRSKASLENWLKPAVANARSLPPK